MLSTKKLLILSAAALLLGLIVSGYFLAEVEPAGQSASIGLVEAGTETAAFIATAKVAEGIDRSAIVDSLRLALEETPEKIVVPVGEERTDFNETGQGYGETEEENDDSGRATREMQWCDATVLEEQFVAAWPSTPVSIEVREGARIIATTETESTSSGSSSEQVLVSNTILQFPLNPALTNEPRCLTHAYIGVTNGGRLIHNNDIILYQGKGASEQVGFAFDGNPIYGGVADGSTLDQCGGKNDGGEYRYHVDASAETIISCFVSEPKQRL